MTRHIKVGREIIFREGTQSKIVEDIINKLVGINFTNGKWEWISPKDIQSQIFLNGHGFHIYGNGSTQFQTDRGLGKKYELKKDKYTKKVCSVGWGSYSLASKDSSIPGSIKLYYRDKPCVICSSTNDVAVDHKDKHKKEGSTNINDYQPLCRKCNTKKRDICNKCEETDTRYDARVKGYSIGWLYGGCEYSPSSIGCKGCYYHDPIFFNKNFDKTKDILMDINKIDIPTKKTTKNLNIFSFQTK